MDDLKYGTCNKRGDWSPADPVALPPMWRRPFSFGAFLRWLPGYFLPWNILFAISAVVWWKWLIPSMDTMRTLSVGWVLYLYAINAVAVFLFYGAFELQLYVLKRQDRRFKYNAKFPAEQKNSVFWFQNQNIDNILRTFLSGVTIWTLIEALVLWAYANGHAPWLGFADHPLWLFTLALLVPVIHEFHFYWIHRAIHSPFLYKWVHSVHHNSVNPSPWSSLSMHPVEHLLYFSTMFYHLILPSNPVIALYQLHFAGFGAIPGHVGFHIVETGEDSGFESHAYVHYLHHKYFEVNYGDALIPLDKWFGTFHDGSPEGERRMQERYRKQKARMAARRASQPAAARTGEQA